MGIDTRLLGEPVDATAAKVVRSKAWESNEGGTRKTVPQWYAPPETTPPPHKLKDRVGTKSGRMVVVGYLGKIAKNKSHLWLARCSCGTFEPRNHKTLAKADPESSDRCQDCREIYFIRREHFRRTYYDKHGKWPDHIRFEG